jgi:tetratricopeptide (TPR) repeat protein
MSVTRRAHVAGGWTARVLLPLTCAALLGSAALDVSVARADAMLDKYFDAMSKSRLLALETGSADKLRLLVAAGEQLFLDQRYADALVVLVEVVDSPRFADYRDMPEAMAAEHMLAATHVQLGSYRTALHYLDRAVARGQQSPYFGPSVALYADAALALSDPEKSALALAPHLKNAPPEVQSEMYYLRGRARFDAGELDRAIPYFRAVHARSRFYGSAQYTLGLIASRMRQLREAESRFCRVAKAGTGSRYSFFVDGRFFEVQDLARLGLGRVAHERLRRDDAFYYYFQVPQDSPRLAEALFESAYSSYEGNEPDTALDLLDQLQVRFPKAPLSDEASILRGYVALARCDFDKANAQLERFVKHYAPVHAEAKRLTESSARRQALHEELVAARRSRDAVGGEQAPQKPEHAVRRELVTLLQVDPELYRVYDEIAKLDAEAARSGRVSVELNVLQARLEGSERPHGAEALPGVEAEHQKLAQELRDAKAGARALGEQLDLLRAAGVPEKELKPLEQIVVEQSKRIDALAKRTRAARTQTLKSTEGDSALAADSLVKLIAADVRTTSRLPTVVEGMRGKLEARADELALLALQQLEQRLAGWLGQARIGRIDAVMGSKRRIERQIESLAAGRMPRELQDPLRTRGLLADDEEYWPFEGEDWPDEHEERYPNAKGAK